MAVGGDEDSTVSNRRRLRLKCSLKTLESAMPRRNCCRPAHRHQWPLRLILFASADIANMTKKIAMLMLVNIGRSRSRQSASVGAALQATDKISTRRCQSRRCGRMSKLPCIGVHVAGANRRHVMRSPTSTVGNHRYGACGVSYHGHGRNRNIIMVPLEMIYRA